MSTIQIHTRLTLKELNTIKFISDGWANKDIAKKQECSVKAVENRISNLFFKLFASNRAELVAKAFRAGLLSASVLVAQTSALTDTNQVDDLERVRMSQRTRGGRDDAFISLSLNNAA